MLKTFGTEVLLAEDLNAIMVQTVIRVPDVPALTALTPVQAGMMAYCESDATTYRHTGTAWRRWLYDTGWVNVAIAPGYAKQSTDEQPCVRDLNGTITTRGVFASTGLTTNTTHTVGTLPAGFEPPVNVIGKAGTSTGGLDATVFFTSAGLIQLRVGPSMSSYYGVGGWAWSRD